MGEVDKTYQIIKEVKVWPQSYWRSFKLANLCASVDDFESSIKWLIYEPHHSFIPWVSGMPQYEKLANKPQFLKFVADLNLPKESIEENRGRSILE